MAKKQSRHKNRIQVQKVSEALEIISAVGIPVDGMSPRRKERIALALLAAANITVLPRFGRGAEILYIGDTSKKSLLLEEARLKELGFFELAHDAMPDIVAYNAAHNWLFLIEAVHSSNPISKLRHLMLERMTEKCSAPRIYISAFRDRLSFRNWMMEISWETEVWLADSPDHLIHFNGEQFFGAYAAMTAEKREADKMSG